MADSQFADPKLLNRLAWQGRWADRRRSERLARSAFRHGNRLECGLARRTLAWQAVWAGRLAEASTLIESAMKVADDLSPEAVAQIWALSAGIQCGRRDFAAAMDSIERAHEVLGSEGDVDTWCCLIGSEGIAMGLMGEFDRAAQLVDAAAPYAEEATKAYLRFVLAWAQLRGGAPDAAWGTAMHAVVLCRGWENRVVLPSALEVLGAAFARTGRPERAADVFSEAIEIARGEGDARAQCEILNQAGRLAQDTGDMRRAGMLLRQGRNLARQIGFPLWQDLFRGDLSDRRAMQEA
ncbi:hypothetical protein [Wenxinia marina]|uniref:Uncharacterized protein n=1 Tax=Wenxinia marina DSM 24838 TaxID=1123501 RepID=A0A0D0PBY3_9RHOB|nr:hypothetical protein [Wenxinia marina]KIQ68986.1 hypothetical protein Wenmar_02719 [Wenxinia marina DSM 24838]GGL63558.1 hypothetical protein GCM10011392_17850 [Wenxinia marina]